jgi:hypothetical protein
MYKAPFRQSNLLNIKTGFGLLVCLLLPSFYVNAQNLTQSPYSYFGVGDLQYYGSATLGNMGQVSQGLRRKYDINTLNPASYSSLAQTNIEAGAMLMNGTLNSAGTSLKTSSSGLSYFNFGTSIYKKGIGIAFGAAPYSALGYNISRNTPIQTDTSGIINGITSQTGDGGLNRAYVGIGAKVLKHVSVGVNVSYIFGQINSKMTQVVPINYYMFNWTSERKENLNGFIIEYGIQAHFDSILIPWYRTVIDSNGFQHKKFIFGPKIPISLNSGLAFNTETSLNASQTYSFRTLSRGGIDFARDTIRSVENQSGLLTIPLTIKYGIAISNNANWTLAADFGTTTWSNFNSFGENKGLQNSWFLSAGASLLPDIKDDSRNYFKRLEYRIGYRTEKTNIFLNNQDVKINALSFGIGIPIAERDKYRRFSRVNVGFEYLTRGANTTLINETYYKFTVGIVFSDKWFIKYKYD